ncbi:hypothetical protein H5410_061733 [Solanum commersonii]|uniref:Uncharacterized protein n=1 Tax=Solanum commersonii TaxID=4109 RepID=A0A9J5W9H0_SOLCO|nr:hypothetical protein H5410_061733 [Solanum commersonii]
MELLCKRSLMIYSNSRELRKADMDEVQRWILSLLKRRRTTYNESFEGTGEDNIIPDVHAGMIK